MRFKILITLFVFFRIQNLHAQQRPLSEFKQTEFVPTLESKIHFDKNAVYCPTLVFAWNELRKTLNAPILVDSTYQDLYLLNRSNDPEKTLLKSDYTVTVKIKGDSIHVKAELKKSLPLFRPMVSYDNELMFDGRKVSSFGSKGEGNESPEIRYYKDDGNVIVSLPLENPWHEILLFKTDSIFHSMQAAANALQQNLNTVTMELRHGKDWWKYEFGEKDQFIVPIIKFDIKTNYPTMEGKTIASKGKVLRVDEVSQRTAFMIDENGAKVESTGEVDVVFSEPAMEEEHKPKKIIFDKPFFIFIKRKESVNPYLALWITNAELMKP